MEGILGTRDVFCADPVGNERFKEHLESRISFGALDSTALRTEVARAQRALRLCQITIDTLLVGQADGQRALVGEIREKWKAHPLEGDLVEQNTRTHKLTPAGNLVSRAALFVKVFQGIPKP